MIKKYIGSTTKEYTSLIEALDLEEVDFRTSDFEASNPGTLPIERKNPVISVTGAGGKTTMITKLAWEYRKKHIPVIVTTTTHMKIEDAPWFVLESSMETVMDVLSQEGMAWVGIPAEEGKMKAPPGWLFEQLLNCGCVVLIEADGAKRLPLKAPAEHEPVILKETTHVVYVCGLDAAGKPFQEVCFRPVLAAEILHKGITDRVCPEDILNLAFCFKGGKKGVLPTMKYSVILNKADTWEREQTASKICSLAEMRGMTDILVTALK